ncbi:cyclic nucleotide-binding domain-containing protein [Polaromonas naphthalenivorans]|uniref:Cyclic nucleotide-binding protein n=1 Tax=Polaromonas naphthalenivorans (strain CJ2) TaxID=365044 RepID=A1VIG3_POLNA|nr:cyclic nucleotide-binding domain-containing protein [Polaromonas naphthalenivorans]ABM35441.1 cyclic nucleotide-binding protein [Polaromonas naphthalenivorans CJ2]
MFKNIFKKPLLPADGRHQDKAGGSGSADLAAEMLIAPTALMQLSLEEARVVVLYMQPQLVAKGTIFIREGDGRDTGFMMLLLDGEVTVETVVVSRAQPIIITVMGPGSLIGELGFLDAQPRYASCIAATPLRCAILTREALNRLMLENAPVAAKLMLALSLRIGVRLREITDKLKMYVQLTQAMEQEIASRITP